METEVLDNNGTQQGAVSQEQKPETVTITKAERDALVRERDEAKQSERYWSERARQNSGSEQDGETEEEEEDGVDVSDVVPEVTGSAEVDESIYNDPDKWLEAVSKGPKAIEALIKKQGFVTGADAAQIALKVAQRSIKAERGKIGAESQVIKDFPELADRRTPLYRATAEEFAELMKVDPRARKSPAMLYAAARTAKARLEAAGGKGNREDGEDGEIYDRADTETERLRRVRAQGGGKPNRGTEQAQGMSAQQKQVAAAMGVSDDTFTKHRDAIRGRNG